MKGLGNPGIDGMRLVCVKIRGNLPRLVPFPYLVLTLGTQESELNVTQPQLDDLLANNGEINAK